ncbi:cytotoxic necrotizing factor Rho-activating domain-containing protein, partial [Vibrio parahaemolyticus]
PQKKTPFRVGNHLTLISNSNGKVNISTLCDDMSINKTRCSTESLESKVVKLA